MENLESEGGAEQRRRKLTKTQRNVIIGVATVAGLGLVGKIVAVLRREKPKKKKDKDVETLESVVSRDESTRNNLPLQQRVQRTKLANLDNDEPDHEVVNRKKNSKRSKYADSFSEIISEDDIAEDGEMYVNQDPIGRRDRPDSREKDARDTITSRKSKQLSSSEGGFNIKGMSHFNGENGGKHHDEDGGRRRNGDGGRRRSEDGGHHHNEDGSQSPSKRSR